MDVLRSRLALLALCALAVSACGTTVPLAERQQSAPAQVSGEGLGQVEGADGVAVDSAGAPLTGVPDAAAVDGSGSAPGTGSAPAGPDLPGSPRSGTSTQPGSAPTGDAPARGPGAGRPAVTSPISLGFIVEKGNGQQANESAGVSTGTTLTLGAVFKGLVKAFNAAGGVSGRRIAPTYYETDPTATDYNRERAAACAAFTQDAKVAVALTVSDYDDGFSRCLRGGGAYQVDSGAGGTSAATARATTNFLSTAAPSMERRERALFATGQEIGSFPKGTTVGVIVDACPETRAGYEKGLVPAAKAAGVTLVPVEVQCVTGFSDLGPIATALQNAVLRFRSSGATQVTYVSNVESTEVLLFAQSAESQGYRPGYVLSSRAQPIAIAQNSPAAQLANMKGMGWQPSLDVALDKQPPRSAVQKRCLALLRSSNVLPTSSADFYYAYSGCDTFFALEALLRSTAGRSSIADLGAAGGGLGTSLVGAATFSLSYAPGALDGAASRRAFRYDTGCSCFTFAGPERPLR